MILIVIGLILFSSARASQEKVIKERVGQTLKQRSVSALLQKGDKMVVEFRQGANWTIDPHGFEISDEPPYAKLLYVFIDIQGPVGSATKFLVALVYSETSPVLLLWNINVTQQDGLNTAPLYDEYNKRYKEIGGFVEHDGNYTVTLVDVFPQRSDPPSDLEIWKETIVIGNPSIIFLLGGVVTLGGGAIALLIGLKRPKHRALIKKKSGVRH